MTESLSSLPPPAPAAPSRKRLRDVEAAAGSTDSNNKKQRVEPIPLFLSASEKMSRLGTVEGRLLLQSCVELKVAETADDVALLARIWKVTLSNPDLEIIRHWMLGQAALRYQLLGGTQEQFVIATGLRKRHVMADSRLASRLRGSAHMVLLNGQKMPYSRLCDALKQNEIVTLFATTTPTLDELAKDERLMQLSSNLQ